MRKVVYLVILAGILLMLYPTLNHWVEDIQQERLLKSLEAVAPQSAPTTAESIGSELNNLFAVANASPAPETTVPTSPGQPVAEQKQVSVEADHSLKKPISSTPAKKAAVIPQTKAMGIIRIDAIDLKLSFIEGINSQDLKVAPGHIPGTAVPGQVGNAVIAGHHSYSYGRMFNRLEQLEINDTVNIDISGHTYSYSIYDKKMVDPTDISVLNQSSKDKILTLITCDEEGKQRLILHAKLIQKA